MFQLSYQCSSAAFLNFNLKMLQRKKPLDIKEFFCQMRVCLTAVAELIAVASSF